jgi:large subunit ribosomal protein L23
MALFDIFKKKAKPKPAKPKPQPKAGPPQAEKAKKPKPQPKAGSPRAEKEAVKKEKELKKVRPEVGLRQKVGEAKERIERVVLIKPIITEKASSFGELNKYVFEVTPRANKFEIKKAIQAVYGFTPAKVNIISVKGRKVRYGRIQGRTKAWKKAIITLKPGDRIELYERK